MKTRYYCEKCEQAYMTPENAQACESKSGDGFASGINIGDIVTCGGSRRFGWFNGDVRWVANDLPGDPTMHGFYYVVTAIELDGHQTRVHLRTKAMDVDGYTGGWTSVGHCGVVKVTHPPEFVVTDSKDLIGQKDDRLV